MSEQYINTNSEWNNFWSTVRHLFARGFFHIAGTNVVNKIIAAFANILTIRILGKYAYGVLGTAYNVYSIFALFSGFGVQSAILIFCSEDRSNSEKLSYYRYGLIAGFIASLCLSVGMLCYAVFGKLGIQAAKQYVIMLCMLPLLGYAVQFSLIVLRTRRENKKYALMQNVSCVSNFLFGCGGAYIWGIPGAIIGRYVSNLIVFGLCFKDILPFVRERVVLPREKKLLLWDFSIKNGCSGALNHIIYLIDIAMIAYMISDPETIASYKVAVMIPEAMSFIPTSIMVYFLPIIVKHNDDYPWLRSKITKLLFYSGIFHAFVASMLVFFAPYIITLLWGREYLGSTVCFRIISVSYFFLATFRFPCTNILAGLKKTNFNLVLSVASACFNMIMNYMLIKNYSSYGAAIATLSTVIFISCISVPYLIYSVRRYKIE